MKYIILTLLLVSGISFTQEDGLKLGGYLETKLSCLIADDEVTSSNALFRLEGKYDIGDKGKIETHLVYNYDLQPVDPFASFKENSIYTKIMGEGATSLDSRFAWQTKVFRNLATYNGAIADYMEKATPEQVRSVYDTIHKINQAPQ